MTNTIRIHKEAGAKKDAIRVNTAKDIPDFLKSTIALEGGQVKLVCVEGTEFASLGSVIGYEESEKTSTGWNTWCIGNAATNLIERDGIFYKKATVFTAQKVNDKVPDFLEGANIRHNSDGTPDANILTKTEKSYKDYIVCDENGNDIGLLSEIDPV